MPGIAAGAEDHQRRSVELQTWWRMVIDSPHGDLQVMGAVGGRWVDDNTHLMKERDWKAGLETDVSSE